MIGLKNIGRCWRLELSRTGIISPQNAENAEPTSRFLFVGPIRYETRGRWGFYAFCVLRGDREVGSCEPATSANRR